MLALKFFSHLTSCFLATQFNIPENINFYGVHDFLNNFHSNYRLCDQQQSPIGCQYSELHLTQITTFEQECKKGFCNQVYRISLNNSWGRLYLFRTKRGDYSREGDYLREAIILNIDHWKSRPKYIFFIFH